MLAQVVVGIRRYTHIFNWHWLLNTGNKSCCGYPNCDNLSADSPIRLFHKPCFYDMCSYNYKSIQIFERMYEEQMFCEITEVLNMFSWLKFDIFLRNIFGVWRLQCVMLIGKHLFLDPSSTIQKYVRLCWESVVVINMLHLYQL